MTFQTGASTWLEGGREQINGENEMLEAKPAQQFPKLNH